MLTLDYLCRELKKDHEKLNSWRKAGGRWGLNPASARLIAMGHIPGPSIRRRLGLPEFAQVTRVDGAIPPGTQSRGALYCKDCGGPFIPNHPRRKKCFECSPFKGRRK